jgi:hypothetical protein
MIATTRLVLVIMTMLHAPELVAASIKATIDRTDATLDDRLTLRVSVEGGGSGKPALPPLKNFDVRSAGTSHQMQIINGQLSRYVTFSYHLRALEVGVFEIGSCSIEIDGKRHLSRPFKIKISNQVQSGSDTLREAFIRVRVSEEKAYIGQQIIYTFQFFRKVSVGDANAEFPDFDGFITEDLGEQRDFSTLIKGQDYQVTELKKALFAQEAGTLVIPGSRLQIDILRGGARSVFDPFGSFGRQSEHRTLRSKDLNLEILSLPSAPSNFGGLVGRFQLKSQLSKSEIRVGESTTLTLTVVGRGNVRSITKPIFKTPKSFKMYEDKPQGHTNKNRSHIEGSKTFRYSLVPLEPGHHKIPGAHVTYFSPKTKTYEVKRTRSFDFNILPAQNAEELRLTEVMGQGGSKIAVKILATDIRPPYTHSNALNPLSLLRHTSAGWFLALISPYLFYLGAWGWHRRQVKDRHDINRVRKRGALKTAQKSLQELTAGQDTGQAAALASGILRGYLGDILAVEGRALTPDEAAEKLAGANLSEQLIDRVRKILRALEAAQYGSREPLTASAASLANALDSLLNSLHREFRS